MKAKEVKVAALCWLLVLGCCSDVNVNTSQVVEPPPPPPPRILQYGKTSSLPPVLWRAPIGCDNSGFFVEIVSLLRGLLPFFEPMKLFLDIGRCTRFDSFSAKDTRVLKSLQHSFATYPPQVSQSIVIHHKLPGQAAPPELAKSQYLVGRMMTESTILASNEVHQADIMDEIWVPTAFHADVFAKHGVAPSKIHVIPLSVDVSFYSEEPKPPRGEIFRFLSVCKYERRKGIDVLLKSYWSSFEKEDQVELLIRSYKPSWERGPEDLDKVFNSIALKFFGRPMNELAKVVWVKRELSKTEMRSLYLSSDLFVLPTRGEGWCLPCAEALAVGTPVAVTNFSGPTAYLSEEYSFPIQVFSKLNADGTAEPNEEHLSRIMRYVSTMPASDLNAMSEAGKTYAISHFDAPVVALQIIKRLNTINNNQLTPAHNNNDEL